MKESDMKMNLRLELVCEAPLLLQVALTSNERLKRELSDALSETLEKHLGMVQVQDIHLSPIPSKRYMEGAYVQELVKKDAEFCVYDHM